MTEKTEGVGEGERIEKETDVLELGALESSDISVKRSDSMSLSASSEKGSE